MSHLLWKYYWETDVERFHRLLALSGTSSYGVGRTLGFSESILEVSPINTSLSSSPRAISSHRSRKVSSGHGTPATSGPGRNGAVLGRTEVNSRDHAGLTVLLRAAASTAKTAESFVRALLEHPAIDIHVQDPESGWNALHRSLYMGNISIACLLLEKERMDLMGQTLSSPAVRTPLLIKTKDHEGKSPFELYNTLVVVQPVQSTLGLYSRSGPDDEFEDDVSSSASQSSLGQMPAIASKAIGDEVYVLGSNKNLSLGVGDEDDRQFPERINLMRPEQLLQKLANLESTTETSITAANSVDTSDSKYIPTVIRNGPLCIEDVVMSKFHSAIITSDSVCNLYAAGLGRGGRLGLGDENTQFRYVPMLGPFRDKKVHKVALGQNHSMAIAGNGELWTWGLNSDAQLGYVLPPPPRGDVEPMSLSPRQLFATLKKEKIQGIAASIHHSVAHTGASLYCWGRNLGQLGLMDSDSRSLETQLTPRKVAASLFPAPIVMVSAVEKATTCLLANHAVCVFANYGYNFVKFPLPDPRYMYKFVMSQSQRYDPERNPMLQIASGGETITVLTQAGHLFTMTLNNQIDNASDASTTNPAKIKSAVTNLQHVWNSRKERVTSVDVGDNGSVVICTESGAAWRRVKRSAPQDATTRVPGSKAKDFKFQRIPTVTNAVAVRSSTFGAIAVIRKDCDIMRTDIRIGPETLWDDVAALLSIREFRTSFMPDQGDRQEDSRRIDVRLHELAPLAFEIIRSTDIETDMARYLDIVQFRCEDFDAELCTSTAPTIKIPVHSWLLNSRSSVIREAMADFFISGAHRFSDTFTIQGSKRRQTIIFENLDFISLINVVTFMYLDVTVPVWEHARQNPVLAYRYRQVRVELMKLATKLNMPRFEAAARLQTTVVRSLADDMLSALKDSNFFLNADVAVELDGGETRMHSHIVARRCPFFETLFFGRSQGLWIKNRKAESDILTIDLKHVSPATFSLVLSHIYADVGTEMFDNIVTNTLEEFIDLVIGVMSVANELILERLSQICQQVIGNFVTTRNIATLMNEISPCAMTGFKTAGLQYICLQMETMLENHLLQDLDLDLMTELEDTVRSRQCASLPLSKGGKLELELHAKYPELASDINEERHRRVQELLFRARMKEDGRKLPYSQRTLVGSLGDIGADSPTPFKSSKRSKADRTVWSDLTNDTEGLPDDHIFSMDEYEHTGATLDPKDPSIPLLSDSNVLSKGLSGKSPLVNTSMGIEDDHPSSSPAIASPKTLTATSKSGHSSAGSFSSPWTFAAYPGTKMVGLRDIMSETSTSEGMGQISGPQPQDITPRGPKVSQRERKKQQQQQQQQQIHASAYTTEPPRAWTNPSRSSPDVAPWKRKSLNMGNTSKEPVTPTLSPLATSTTSSPASASDPGPSQTRPAPRQTGSSDTRFSGQKSRTVASSSHTSLALTPHSKSYIKSSPKTEPVFGLGIADIIVQQQREQDAAREAVKKRSLKEIQQEQAFQEWWDQESKRMQEEEVRRISKEKEGEEKAKNRGGSRRRGRGMRNRDKGEASTSTSFPSYTPRRYKG